MNRFNRLQPCAKFEGSGAIIVGSYLPTDGKADVYLDGKLHKGGEAVWHAFGLSPGKHALRLVVRAEPYEGSKGSDIDLTDLIVFRK